jgi:pyruvate dehydrogenase E2 component (dihydrolipoamide acetyltransferase)
MLRPPTAPAPPPSAPSAPAAPPTAGYDAPPPRAEATGGSPARRRAEAGTSYVPTTRTVTPADLSVYVTPLVRRLAAENDVDLRVVNGTGVGGRVRKQDVLDAAESVRAAKTAEEEARKTASSTTGSVGTPTDQVSALRGQTVPMSRLRKVIARRMVESLHVSAQLTTVVEADVTRIARLRALAKADFKAREGVRLSFLPFFALAVVEALKQYPVVNASIEGENIVYHGEENLGVAVDTERGLLVPVIHNAGDLNIAGLARKIADLAERTRANKVTADELGGGTFTLTNTGSRGALFDTPIINQPQVAILGTGAVVKRAIVTTNTDDEESIAVRSMVYLALSYDHRIVDGADAARFLTTVKQRLEDGRFEAALGL